MSPNQCFVRWKLEKRKEAGQRQFRWLRRAREFCRVAGRALAIGLSLSALWLGLGAMPAWGAATARTHAPPAGNSTNELQQLRQALAAMQASNQAVIQTLRQQVQQNQAVIQALERTVQQLQAQLAAGASNGPSLATATTAIPQSPPNQPAPGGEAELDAWLQQSARKPAAESKPAADELDQFLSGGKLGPAPPGAVSSGGLGQTATRAFQSMNPNISAIGDVLGHYTSHDDSEFGSGFFFRELELGFSASVDPFARADFFLSTGQEPSGDWATEVEEGYVTLLTLPYGLQPRFGRFRASLGRANGLHLHALPWVEYPLVIENYFGEEGLKGNGVGMNWLIPNPWNQFIELTYEATMDPDQTFLGEANDSLRHLARLHGFIDLSAASTVELGASYVGDPEDDRHLGGLDFTFKWRPPQAGLYRAFQWQTEVLAGQVRQPGGWASSWGMFTALEYQFARRWATGGRYDFSQMPQLTARKENAYSAYLTFIQSEFMFWRLGYQFTDRNFQLDRNQQDEHELFLQCNFGIGPHRAHKF